MFLSRILTITLTSVLLSFFVISGNNCEAECGHKDLTFYIQLGLENNSELKAAFYDWQSSLFTMKASDALPDPNLNYWNYIRSIETRIGPLKNMVGLSQQFPWIGKLRNRKQLAYRRSLVAQQKLYVLTAKLIREIKDAFYRLNFIERSITITRENIEILELLERTALQEVEVGKRTMADSLQTQIDINRLHDDVAALQKQKQSLVAKIAALLNIGSGDDIALPENLFEMPFEIPEAISEKQLREWNPTLILQSLRAEEERANYRLVKQDRYPDVTVGIDWIDAGKAIAPTPDSGKDPLIAKVALNLPIWTRTYRARENAARSQIFSVNDMLNQSAQDIFANFEDIRYKFQDAERRATLYHETLVPQTWQTLQMLTESYKTGEADFDRVLEIERMLLHFQLEYERAMTDLAIEMNAFEEIIGACSR